MEGFHEAGTAAHPFKRTRRSIAMRVPPSWRDPHEAHCSTMLMFHSGSRAQECATEWDACPARAHPGFLVYGYPKANLKSNSAVDVIYIRICSVFVKMHKDLGLALGYLYICYMLLSIPWYQLMSVLLHLTTGTEGGVPWWMVPQ